MPVNSKKQGQGQTGKKSDDAKTKARKDAGNTGMAKETAPKAKAIKK
jgi:hypothetical protein